MANHNVGALNNPPQDAYNCKGYDPQSWFVKYDNCFCPMCQTAHNVHYDAALHLELAEHAYLVSVGFSWGALASRFFWFAPYGWTGSRNAYASRAHAINSVKRHRPIDDLVGRDCEEYY